MSIQPAHTILIGLHNEHVYLPSTIKHNNWIKENKKSNAQFMSIR